MEHRLQKLWEETYPSSGKESYWVRGHANLRLNDETYIFDTVLKAIETGIFGEDFIQESLRQYSNNDMGIASKTHTNRQWFSRSGKNQENIRTIYEALENIKETIGVKQIGCYVSPHSREEARSLFSVYFDYVLCISHIPGRNIFLSNEYQPPCYLVWTFLDVVPGDIFNYIETWYPFGQDIVQIDNRVVDEISDWGLSTLIKIHQRSCKWVYGKPVKAFLVKSAYGDKKYVVCYSSGDWWYYTTPLWKINRDKS